MPLRVGTLGMLAGFVAAPLDGPPTPTELPIAAALVAGAIVLGVLLWLPLTGLTRVALRPAGLRAPRSAHWAAGWYEIPWEAVSTDRWRWIPGNPSTCAVEIARPDLVRRHGWIRRCPRWLTVGTDLVDPVRLSVALRHYVDHPADRPAIGTGAGLDRLEALIGDAPGPIRANAI